MTTKNVPSSNRRWLRFSLRTLLIVMCVVGLALGWLGSMLARIRHQRGVVARIEAIGGEWHYAHLYGLETGAPPWPYMGKLPDPPGPAWIRRILGDDAFAYVEWVSFDSSRRYQEFDWSRFKQDDLRVLAELPQLKAVTVPDPQITDSGFAHIVKLPKLSYLSIANPQITPDGFRVLQTAENLESLELGDCTDECLAHLGPMPNLRALKISSTDITDDGLAHLARLQNLERLGVWCAYRVTDRGIAHLRGLVDLKDLELGAMEVTDEAIVQLAEMHQLQTLLISGDAFTDSGIRKLQSMHGLRQLHFSGGDITREGVVELMQALPQCKVDSKYEFPSKW